MSAPNAGWDPALTRRSRRAFAIWGGLLVTFALAWTSAWYGEDAMGIPRFFRKGLSFNGLLWRGYSSNARENHVPPVTGKAPRANGDVGLDAEGFEVAKWAMAVEMPGKPALSLNMAALQWQPLAESSAEFRCIEGWSEPISYAGVRFTDFLRHYNLGRRSGAPWGAETPTDLYEYVSLETPDGEYYVSIDMESMLHAQTMLAWQMNGEPLSLENGAPLRLIIPQKYGIKNLKRIGKITFSDHRPPDYWAERGYDWFAGL